MNYIQRLKVLYFRYSSETIRVSILPISYALARILGLLLIGIIAPNINIFETGCGKNDVELKEDISITLFFNVCLIMAYLALFIRIDKRSLLACFVLIFMISIVENLVVSDNLDGWIIYIILNAIIDPIVILILILLVYISKKWLLEFRYSKFNSLLLQSVIYWIIVYVVLGPLMMNEYQVGSQQHVVGYILFWAGLLSAMFFRIRIQCLKYLYPMVVVGLPIAYITGIANDYYPYLPQPRWSIDFVYVLLFQSIYIISPIIFNEFVRTLVNRIDNKIIFENIP